MPQITQDDAEAFIGENYMAYLLLGGLLIVMYLYRNVHLPAGKAFRLIAVTLFVMCLANSLERWAVMTPERVDWRVLSSVIHYITQPLVIYMELMVIRPRYMESRVGRTVMALPLLINTAIYAAAPFAGHLVFWYADDYTFQRGPLGISIYVVTFFYLALLIVWSIKTLRDEGRENRMSVLLLFIAGIAVLNGVLEALNFAPGYIDEAFVLGTLLFYMYLITLHESDMRAELIRKKLELSKSELVLLRRQIRQHFIFNSLYNIKSLIRRDPEKAVVKLEDFSEYLRANLDTISGDTLIPFEEELNNIEAYVSLALVDEEKDIRIEYDIKEQYFRLPPLTVEPIVENAIKHGSTEGGTVRIATSAAGDAYMIKVSDNGCGFHSGNSRDKAGNAGTDGERRGVGLENVEKRLDKLCKGRLEIDTGDNGTVVTILIPKQKGDLS